MRQHEAVVQLGAPAHQRALIGIRPEAGDERAEQKLLGKAHPRVRRHFEGAQLNQTQPPAAGLRRVELIDAKFRPVRVAGYVDEQVAKKPVHQPWRAR